MKCLKKTHDFEVTSLGEWEIFLHLLGLNPRKNGSLFVVETLAHKIGVNGFHMNIRGYRREC